MVHGMASDGSSASFVVVANRLPVEAVTDGDGPLSWRVSPGGLVAALGPVMERNQGTWVGWTGYARRTLRPFRSRGHALLPIELSDEDVAEYYEGFSNAHPLAALSRPDRRSAVRATMVGDVSRRQSPVRGCGRRRGGKGGGGLGPGLSVAAGPGLLRDRRPDLRIGFFNHIPFPGFEIYSRLPWRRQLVEGLLGADLIGFQGGDDAANFLRAAAG